MDSCLLDGHYLGETGFAVLDFPFRSFALKAGSGVTCAFEGLDNVYLEAFRQILRQNSAEAE